MRVLVFDVETTGLVENRSIKLERQPEIIEWASSLVNLDTGEVEDEFDTLIRPRLPIPDKVRGITRIDDRMVENSPSFEEVADRIVNLVETSPMVIAHNARFDVDMTEIELERLGRTVRWPQIICSIEETMHLEGKRMNLGHLHEKLLGFKFSGAHRARDDVAALIKCLIELRRRGELPYD